VKILCVILSCAIQIHGEKIKTLLFNFEEHGQTLFLTTKEDLMTFLGNATDSQGYHNWSAKLWNGATHSIMDPFGFDITSTIALEWTLPTASDGPDASPSRTDSSQPHVFVSIKFDLKCRSKIVMDVSLDLIEVCSSCCTSNKNPCVSWVRIIFTSCCSVVVELRRYTQSFVLHGSKWRRTRERRRPSGIEYITARRLARSSKRCA